MFALVLNVQIHDNLIKDCPDLQVACMGHLLNVRDRAATTDEMFEPLKQTIDLLKSYDHEMSEEVHQQLQVCYVGLFYIMCVIV